MFVLVPQGSASELQMEFPSSSLHPKSTAPHTPHPTSASLPTHPVQLLN